MVKGRQLTPFLLLLIFLHLSSSDDTLTPSQSLSGNQTLVSAGGKFELGFFTPPGANADKTYLGIWYHNLPVHETTNTYVWVANRDSPATDASASLKLLGNSSTQIAITAGEGLNATVTWSSSNSSAAASPVLQLLDSGNLVVREAGDTNNNYLWESFDYPTDTMLATQRISLDNITGVERYLRSWKSPSDPSSGDYTFRLRRTGIVPEILLQKDGNIPPIYRSGPWTGQRFCGVPTMNRQPTPINFTFQDEPAQEVYFEFTMTDPTIMSRSVLHTDGFIRRYNWVADSQGWNLYWNDPRDQCDYYNACGDYGLCGGTQDFGCVCPRGFEPNDTYAWARNDFSSGCKRRTSLECGTDGFTLLGSMKLPETGAAVAVYKDKGLQECREMCIRDCNCTAYANRWLIDEVGSGCLMWTNSLKDMRTYSGGGQNLYVRIAAADLERNKSHNKVMIGIGVSVGVVMLIVAIAFRFTWKKKKRFSTALNPRVTRELVTTNDSDDLELPLYAFEEMVVATNNFAYSNKIGEGGFGYVYKGVLKDGQVVAIKRLSKLSEQGDDEFKTEVKLIAKLQHRNLVRILGCCLAGEEKMLLYEYMSNKSLDTILFQKERSSILDWKTRFNIICGIARGLQYLHHDSVLRIIHRDFKASNILLDHDMNPKISDFGIARIFWGDETGAKNTTRVVGTYGYMAPEYAMDGVFSIKSDTFSFGVLVLEIVTGKKNTGFYNSDADLTLLGYAWKTWREGRGIELLDPCIGYSYSEVEVWRCIQIGLLCVQEHARERPTMSSVVAALSSEGVPLPDPKLPGFCVRRRPGFETVESSSSQQYDTSTVNQVTVTMLDGR